MEDYKKKYEDALERAKSAIKECGNNVGRIKMIESIFPELKESEDEQHRKWILEYLYDGLRKSDEQFKDQFKSAIAWFEKQGEQSKEVTYTHEVETGNGNIRALVTEKHKFNAGDWIVSKYGDLFQIKEVVAGGYKLLCPSGNVEINSIRNVDNNSHLWSIKDAKDGDVLACCDNKPFIFKGFFDLNFPNCLAAYCGVTLENQFGHCNGKTFWTNQDVKPATKKQCNLLFQKMHEAGYEWDAEKKECRTIPKFKVGDWINGYYTNYKVLSINNNGYFVEDVDGNKINILFENEKFHHLWTIRDAKPGDVIADNENNDIGIFESLGHADHGSNNDDSYCFCFGILYSDDFFWSEFERSDSVMYASDGIHPATKEQRELLFKKMAESGYEWDAEKKELSH